MHCSKPSLMGSQLIVYKFVYLCGPGYSNELYHYCHIRTCNHGCNINEEIKVDLIMVHSITRISTAPITEYLNKHDTWFFYTALICDKTCKSFIPVKKKESNKIKIDYFEFLQCFNILHAKEVTEFKISSVIS